MSVEVGNLAGRRFEEIAVGDPLSPLAKTITHNQLVRYSGASGDFNPIHTDPEAAKAAGLDGVIAHGLLNMAFLGQLVTDWCGDPGAVRQLHCRFSKMVRPGDTVTAKGSVAEKKVVDGEQLVYLKVWVENQRGEIVLSNGLAVVALPSRDGQ